VYEELLRRAAAEPYRAELDARREQFVSRTTSSTAPSLRHGDASLAGAEEARLAAGLDDALTQGGLAARIAHSIEDPKARALARVIGRAQRGLFAIVPRPGPLVVRDYCRRGEFVVVDGDDVGRALRVPGAEPSLVDGRIVAAADGCALLPGAIFHPAEATPLLGDILAEARRLAIEPDDLCDTLLAMHHVFLALPRVKIGFAYKIESLRAHSPRPASVGLANHADSRNV
jgi:hypothetical protein